MKLSLKSIAIALLLLPVLSIAQKKVVVTYLDRIGLNSGKSSAVKIQVDLYEDKSSKGIRKVYTLDSLLISKGEYSDLKKNIAEGQHSEYDSSGRLIRKIFYVNGEKEGDEIRFHKNDTISSITPFVKGVMEGKMTEYYENGFVSAIIHYSKGNKNGETISYYENGNLKSKGNYKDDLETGEHYYYYKSGEIRRKEVFKNGTLVSGKCFTESGQDTTYFPHFKQAEHPGGLRELGYFIQVNLRYPDYAKEKNIQGMVYVQFLVEKTGKITEINTIKAPHIILALEAERVIRLFPNFIPAQEEGVPVNSRYTLPLNFKLS